MNLLSSKNTSLTAWKAQEFYQSLQRSCSS